MLKLVTSANEQDKLRKSNENKQNIFSYINQTVESITHRRSLNVPFPVVWGFLLASNEKAQETATKPATRLIW